MLRNLWMMFAVAAMSLVLFSCSGRSDEDIRKEISEKMTSMPDMAGITYEVKDGVVTTAGMIKDEASKQTAETTIKGIKGVKSVVNNTTVTPAETQAPVEIAPDTALTSGVADAVKDFPGVNAQVNDGEITLTGQITRAKLPTLMQSLSTLKPKKINNQLTIK